MASIEKTKTALAAMPEQQSLQELVTKSAKELGKALPEHMRPERLCRIALTNVRMNPELGKCTPASFLGALFTAAQIGIEPVAGRAYILPFNNNRKQPDGSWRSVKEAQFILGYKGVAELFYRHEKAVELSWSEVCENDEFEYQYGTDAFLKHKPAPRLRGPVIAYYVVAKLQNGGKPFMVMSKEDCMEHGRKHSKTYDKKTMEFYAASPWSTSPDAMCLKTVLIQLAKLLPLSVEVQRAIEADESSRDYRDGIGDALDLPTTTNWKEAEVSEPTAEEIDKGTEEAKDDFFPDKKV
jgi:recombination protein RecT